MKKLLFALVLGFLFFGSYFLFGYDLVNVLTARLEITETSFRFSSLFDKKEHETAGMQELRHIRHEWKNADGKCRSREYWFLIFVDGRTEQLKYLWFDFDSPKAKELESFFEELKLSIKITHFDKDAADELLKAAENRE